jgi:hypothetical protein
MIFEVGLLPEVRDVVGGLSGLISFRLRTMVSAVDLKMCQDLGHALRSAARR